MTDFVVYDKAKWHYEGNFPSGIPRTQAYVHTGMFLTWIIDHDLYSEEFLEDYGDRIALVKRRELLGSAIYVEGDGVFAEDMLNSEGNAFTQYYYNLDPKATPNYLRDYAAILEPHPGDAYKVQDNWDNYAHVASRIDQRYQEWLDARRHDSAS